jgi:predicted Zn-dependent peptidase
MQTVMELMVGELQKLKKDKITKEEFLQSKEQLKGNYILALENTSAKMNAIGKGKLLTGKLTTEEETIELVNKVSLEDAVSLIDSLINFDACTITAVGKENIKIEDLKI